MSAGWKDQKEGTLNLAQWGCQCWRIAKQRQSSSPTTQMSCMMQVMEVDTNLASGCRLHDIFPKCQL